MKSATITITITLAAIVALFGTASCDQNRTARATNGQQADSSRIYEAGGRLQANMPTPTDIEYSLERYNLIRRTYWINGLRERARALPNPVPNMPLGHVVLFTQSGAVVGKFMVSGKVTSLNSYLTPDSEYYGQTVSGGGNGLRITHNNKWLPDVDGAYGKNDNGIFFFTPDGKYIEWNGNYLYSDIPFETKNPVLQILPTP